MGNAKSISEAYEGWQDASGDVDELREYIAQNAQHIEKYIFRVCLQSYLNYRF